MFRVIPRPNSARPLAFGSGCRQRLDVPNCGLTDHLQLHWCASIRPIRERFARRNSETHHPEAAIAATTGPGVVWGALLTQAEPAPIEGLEIHDGRPVPARAQETQ